jgi:peptidoglycan/LPS O-acetylase OafA/YrhL
VPAGGRRANHLAPLTGLRFLAAANVLAFHYAPHAATIDLTNVPLLVYLAVLSGGASSVSLFFVLSGFVLAHRYLNDDGRFTGSQARFWGARLRRLLPAYLLGYALALGWLITHGGADLAASLASIGLVQAWWGPVARLVNSPAWSLSVEMFFYAAFPLVAPPVFQLALKRPVAVVAALFLVCIPGPLLCGLAGAGEPSTGADFWRETALNLPLFHLPTFVMGVATAAAFRTSPHSTARWATPGEILPTIGALCCLVLISGTLPGPLVRDGALGPWFALVVLRLARGRGMVSRVLGWPLFVVLGEASYALYIVQEPLWNWWGTFLEWLGYGGALDTWPGFLAFVVTAIVLSLAIRRWWDTWLTRWAKVSLARLRADATRGGRVLSACRAELTT